MSRDRRPSPFTVSVGIALAALVALLAGCTAPSAADPGSASGAGVPAAGSSAAGNSAPGSEITVPALGPGGGKSPDSATTPIAAQPGESADGSNADLTAPPPPATPAMITTSVESTTGQNPVIPVTVHVDDGTLTDVTLTNPTSGVAVGGALAPDGVDWASGEVLGYAKSYRLTASAVNADGVASSVTQDFTTLKPGNLTMPYFETIGRYPLADGATYGVGIIAIVHFDEPIGDRAAAEKALTVTTTPHVDGSWFWADAQNVHWRPEKFYPAGTQVRIDANVYGVEVGKGLYGESDKSISFTIGREQITYATDSAPKAVNKVVVKDGSGAVLRTMNTSMGRHSGTTVKGKYISFYTMGGTYTVLDHKNPQMMSSASYGLPADSPHGYGPEPIYYATRISTDGIFLHQLNTTVWAQNNGVDTSHGCLNLNKSNAEWFYKNTIVGDPVIITPTKGAPEIQVWQGGDWSVPWATWTAGSALH